MRAALAAVALALAPLAALADAAEPAGFREDDYRAPVPATLAGATVVDAAGAHALWQAGATAFIDVLPRAPKPDKLPEGTVWHEKPRHSVPDATWLPNTGYGKLAPETEAYFRTGLARATGDDTDHPVLFFCLADCWMSWNAAKRALGLGYTQVLWFPGGTDGWTAAGYPTEALEPAP